MTNIEDQAEQPQPLNSEPPLGPVEGRGAAEIRALCDAATPGPWSFYLGDLWAGAMADELATADRLSAEHVFSDEAEDIFERASHLFHGDPVRPEDAAFIAAARDLVPSLLDEVEAAHRFERSAAVEREALLAEVAELRELTDAARLLGPARRVLDMAAEGEATPEECAAMAQRIVDLIGHPVTDEPPHAIVERDSLRGVVQAAEKEARRIVDHATRMGSPDGYNDTWQAGRKVAAERILTALAAAADAPQPTPEDADESAYWFMARHDQHDVGTRHEDGALLSATCHDCDETFDRQRPSPAQPVDPPTCEHGKTERHTFGEVVSKHDAHWIPRFCAGPSPAVLPEKEQRDV